MSGFRALRRSAPKRVEVGGRKFHSQFEAALYGQLALQEKAGEIADLKCQVNVRLTRAMILYIVDFSYAQGTDTVYVEAKGFETDVWNIKKRLWRFYGPGRLQIYRGNAKAFRMVEEIVPNLKGE